MKTVTQGVQGRTYSYDALSRLRQAITPESGTITYTYDKASNLTSRQDAAGTVTNYTYDELYRVLTRSYSGPAAGVTGKVTYTYDAAAVSGAPSGYVQGASKGMLTSVTTTAAGGQDATKIVYGYTTNGNGRLVQRGQVIGSEAFLGKVIRHNLAGMVDEEEYPSGARIIATYNGAGQLKTVSRKRVAGSVATTLASGLKYSRECFKPGANPTNQALNPAMGSSP